MATKTVGLSLSTIVLTLVVLFGIGIVGGAVGARVFSIPLPLRSDTNQTIVPVSQQVTVSPSKLAADLVSSHGKSVFLLAHETTKGISGFGTGIALTNDGVIMSVQKVPKEPVVAIGEDGVAVPLTAIGTDELSGISFYKASDRIVPPFTLLQNNVRTGSSLLALSRESDTTQVSASNVMFSTVLLPLTTSAPGIQKIALLEATATLPAGAALVDENGNLAGVLLDPETNIALFTSDIRSALDRLSGNRLTFNPFTPLGFTLTWRAQLDANKTMKIESVVDSVGNNGQADTAGLLVGDVVSAIGGSAVSWDTNVVDALSANPTLLTVMRDTEQRTISISR